MFGADTIELIYRDRGALLLSCPISKNDHSALEDKLFELGTAENVAHRKYAHNI